MQYQTTSNSKFVSFHDIHTQILVRPYPTKTERRDIRHLKALLRLFHYIYSCFQNTYKFIPYSRQNFLVGASEPFDLPHVALVLVQLGHGLGYVVLRHHSLVKLKTKFQK